MRRCAVGTLLALALAARAEEGATPKKVTFASEDGLTVTADLYLAHEDAATPFIVLFHQARSSRGEYREIAPRLARLGFNCLAVDQRSGAKALEVDNETAQRAAGAEKDASYLAARQDMVAALRHARKTWAKGKLIAWGSSYSASLALEIVGADATLADGVVSFSPGEYFQKLGKADTWIRDSVAGLACPVFITSARKEKPMWEAIYEAIPAEGKRCYVPEKDGRHGSSALWSRFDFSEDYWKAVTAFLRTHFVPQKETEGA